MAGQTAARFKHAAMAIGFPKQVVGHTGEVAIARDDAVARLDCAAEPDADRCDGNDHDLELEGVFLHVEQRDQHDEATVEQHDREHGCAQAVIEGDPGEGQEQQQGDEREVPVDVIRPGGREDQSEGKDDDQDGPKIRGVRGALARWPVVRGRPRAACQVMLESGSDTYKH